jgi:hypothetical protein
MGQLIQLVVVIIIFAIVAYGLKWVCTQFALPQPVLWICGALLLIILLYFIASQLGISGGGPLLLPHR